MSNADGTRTIRIGPGAHRRLGTLAANLRQEGWSAVDAKRKDRIDFAAVVDEALRALQRLYESRRD